MAFSVTSVVLASGSPRRKELLRKIFPEFEIEIPEVDERLIPSEDLFKAAQRLAYRKAVAVRSRRPSQLIIAADTLVGKFGAGHWVIMGKPCDPRGAVSDLMSLSGTIHQVVTGIAVTTPGCSFVDWDCTSVTFRELHLEEVEAYVETGEPLDKAGSYAIQGGAEKFIDRVDGSLSNVIGLPLERLRHVLLRAGYSENSGV